MAAPEGNSTAQILHGLLNAKHTSDLHIFFERNHFPTPWPFLAVSIGLSLILGCLGCCTSWGSWAGRRTGPPKQYNKTWSGFKEAWTDTNNQTQWRQLYDQEQRELAQYPHSGRIATVPDPEADYVEPQQTAFGKIRHYLALVWSTIRAIIAFYRAVTITVSKSGVYSPPSSLLLLLISLQVFLYNRFSPRLILYFTTILIGMVAASFVLSAVSLLRGGQAYADLTLAGGNCPKFAKDCLTQAPLWEVVGCTDFPEVKINDSPRNTSIPHGTKGGVNFSSNQIHIVEGVASVFGCLWMVSVVSNFWIIFVKMRVGQFRNIWQPPDRKADNENLSGIGWGGIIGMPLAIAIGVASVVVHERQSSNASSATFLDGFGPFGPIHNTSQPVFLGNTDRWTDCFAAQLPMARLGFWPQWWNSTSDRIGRVIGFI